MCIAVRQQMPQSLVTTQFVQMSMIEPNTADLTPKAYLVYTKAKQKKFTFTEISFGNVHFCKATATSELGYNINKIRKFKNEMLHQLRLKPAPQEHAK